LCASLIYEARLGAEYFVGGLSVQASVEGLCSLKEKEDTRNTLSKYTVVL